MFGIIALKVLASIFIIFILALLSSSLLMKQKLTDFIFNAFLLFILTLIIGGLFTVLITGLYILWSA